MSFKPRFQNGAYRDCKWCHGSGCLSCQAEADKEYKRQFPNGPEPILTIQTEEFDQLEISESTGGPSMRDSHGELGALAASIFRAVKEQRSES